MKTTRRLLLALATIATGTVVAVAPAQAMQHPLTSADIGSTVMTPAGGTVDARTIVVDDHTRWVNVTNGETVQFDVNGHRFTYAFNAWPNVNSVELTTIAPDGVAAPMVRVYIAPNPISQG
jgi:phage gp45-like